MQGSESFPQAIESIVHLQTPCRWCGSDSHYTDEHFLERDEVDAPAPSDKGQDAGI